MGVTEGEDQPNDFEGLDLKKKWKRCFEGGIELNIEQKRSL